MHEKRFCPDSSRLYTYRDIAFDKRFWDSWDLHVPMPLPRAQMHMMQLLSRSARRFLSAGDWAGRTPQLQSSRLLRLALRVPATPA